MGESPTSATGVLRILPTTKDEIARFSKAVIQSVLDGEVNALEMHVLLKAFEKASELILDAIRTNVMNQVEKYSEKSFEAYGARVDKAEVGIRYKYETSGDTEWETRKTNVESAMALLKEREEFLRTLKEPLVIVDQSTGEVVNIKPPLKVSTTGLKVMLK